jgi:ankyrin repeat protein
MEHGAGTPGVLGAKPVSSERLERRPSGEPRMGTQSTERIPSSTGSYINGHFSVRNALGSEQSLASNEEQRFHKDAIHRSQAERKPLPSVARRLPGAGAERSAGCARVGGLRASRVAEAFQASSLRNRAFETNCLPPASATVSGIPADVHTPYANAAIQGASAKATGAPNPNAPAFASAAAVSTRNEQTFAGHIAGLRQSRCGATAPAEITPPLCSIDERTDPAFTFRGEHTGSESGTTACVSAGLQYVKCAPAAAQALAPGLVCAVQPSPLATAGAGTCPLASPLSTISTPTSATTNYSSLTAIQGPVSPSRKKNSTPLHYACRFGHIQVVQTILESALKNGGEELVRIEADLVAADWKRMTPIHVAAKHGQEAVVALLVEFAKHRVSALLTTGTDSNGTVTITAKRWLQAVLDAPCGEGATALMLAAQHGHAKCVRHLLSLWDGVDPRRRTSTRGWTAATFAARYGHVEVLRELITVTDVRACLGLPPVAQGVPLWDAADVLDMPDAQDGNTPLMIAAKYGKTESVRLLLQVAAWIRGAGVLPAVNAHAANMNGQTAVHLAAQHGHNEVVAELLRFLSATRTTDALHVPPPPPPSSSSSSSSSTSASTSLSVASTCAPQTTRALSRAPSTPMEQCATAVPPTPIPTPLMFAATRSPSRAIATQDALRGVRARQRLLPPLEIPGGEVCEQHPGGFSSSLCVAPTGAAGCSVLGTASNDESDQHLDPFGHSFYLAPMRGTFLEQPQADWGPWSYARISPLSPHAAAAASAAATITPGSVLGTGVVPAAIAENACASRAASSSEGPEFGGGPSETGTGTCTGTPSLQTENSTPSSVSPLLNGPEPSDGAHEKRHGGDSQCHHSMPALDAGSVAASAFPGSTTTTATTTTTTTTAAAPPGCWDAWIKDLVGD